MEKQIEELVSSREKFNAFVYTSLDHAVLELEERQKSDPGGYAVKLAAGVPDGFINKKCAVVFRQLATPNYELRRFVSIVDLLDGFSPVFFEYLEDKFTDNNEWKYSLGKVSFYGGKGKKGGEKIDRLNVIDFNSSRGKKIKDVVTLWGQTLVDFHHELFHKSYDDKKGEISFFDASNWFANSGGNAKDYYKNFLSLFVSNGILFENFMLSEKELGFTKEVFLPAFIKVVEETGKKPLIVALEPTEVESDTFWLCHPETTKPFVDSKVKSVVRDGV